MNAIIISVGSELATGQTVDTNSAFLARQLTSAGIRITAHRTVGDDRAQIAAAISQSADEADVVLITGGLGPTEDDLTREALADAMGVVMEFSEECLARIEGFFRKLGREMCPTNRRQAMVPKGAEPLANEAGTAPGLAAKLRGARIFAMPGVPHEMRWVYHNSIAGLLEGNAGSIVHRTLHTYGAGESDIGSMVSDLMLRDANPTVGTTVAAGMVTLRITSRGRDAAEANALAADTIAETRRRLGALVFATDDETMASVVGKLLRERGQTVATAESCTGGMVGQMITDVPSASDYFLGGVVAYSNRVKQDVLGVGEAVLTEHGAVSEPIAEAMAKGARKLLGSDWAISITGIAGPEGGTPEKPVGLVYVGLASAASTQVHRHVLGGTRQIVRMRAALAALNHLRLALMG